MRTVKGFTLLEMITVVAIVGILMALGIPNYKGWQSSRQLRIARTHLCHVLQHARLCAVKENRKVIVSFDPDGDGQIQGHYVVFVDNALDQKTFWTQEPDERTVYQGRIPHEIDVLDISFAGGKPRVRFDPLGLPNGLGGHIYLTNRQRKYLGIHVNINGSSRRVRSDTGEKGTWVGD